MTHTNHTHTTTEHATIITRTALRTCAMKAGRAEKIDNMRAALAGRDAAVMRMYGRAMDDVDAYDALRVQPLTDAADLVQVAALAIIECAAPCIAAAIAADEPYILPDAVRKAAYKAVHKAIYAAAVRPALRDIYIEDMAHTDDGIEVSDPEYIKVTRYYDVHNWADYAVTKLSYARTERGRDSRTVRRIKTTCKQHSPQHPAHSNAHMAGRNTRVQTVNNLCKAAAWRPFFFLLKF